MILCGAPRPQLEQQPQSRTSYFCLLAAALLATMGDVARDGRLYPEQSCAPSASETEGALCSGQEEEKGTEVCSSVFQGPPS